MSKKNRNKKMDTSLPLEDTQSQSTVPEPITLTTKQYWVILAVFTLAAAILRFWNLGALPGLVFDETYFAKFGFNYLSSTEFFDSHPPLSKYLIGIGIWLYNILPFTQTLDFHEIEITELAPQSWRWMNAFIGTLVIPLAARTVYGLWQHKLVSLLVAFILVLDGILLVESRFGLNNIYIIFFGLLGLYFFTKAHHSERKTLYFMLASAICLGMTYSVKWNGLALSTPVWALLIIVFVVNLRQKILASGRLGGTNTLNMPSPLCRYHPLDTSLIFLFAGLVIYCLLWLPHISQNPQYGLVEMQKQILGYHSGDIAPDSHPYCSAWSSWPLLQRPMSYYFTSNEIDGVKYYTDVHLLGNPPLVWLGFISVFIMLPFYIKNLYRAWVNAVIPSELMFQTVVVVGFFANWLPWMLVSRCIFLYHYVPALIFSLFGVAWVVLKLFSFSNIRWRVAAILLLLMFIISFIYFIPIYIGMSVPTSGFYGRMWFHSWI